MELEDLKSQWQSVKTHIEAMPHQDKPAIDYDRIRDAKSKFQRRMLSGIAIVPICGVLMVTSWLWSPMRLPVWWLALISVATLAETVYSIVMYGLIRRMEPAVNSHSEILSAIVKIKMHYRNMELVISIILVPLLIWLSFTPQFVGTWQMYYVWCLTFFAFGGELLWYRSNIKLLNSFRASKSNN